MGSLRNTKIERRAVKETKQKTPWTYHNRTGQTNWETTFLRVDPALSSPIETVHFPRAWPFDKHPRNRDITNPINKGNLAGAQ